MKKYVIGLDFGTDSCRSIIVDVENGNEIDNEVFYYPRYKQGLYCEPKLSKYRQHPLDYIEGVKSTVSAMTSRNTKEITENIIAISIDTTGSTPCACDISGTPLALLEEFSDNPNAMFILWKDHTAVLEAAEINKFSKTWGGIDFTKFIGGIYSSEWFYAKILKTLRIDEKVRKAAHTWVEHCDWLPAELTGVKHAKDIKRSRCSAGHKAMWNEEFGGLPDNMYFKGIDPLLDGLRDKLFTETYCSDVSAGCLSDKWAEALGLTTQVRVGVGAFDCHVGAVGGNIKPKSIVKVIGTSTCDIMIADTAAMKDKLVEGICGQVDGSVIPGMLGLEAGQSAFGDIFAWFRRLISYPLSKIPDELLSCENRQKIENDLLFELEKDAANIKCGENSIICTDWFNGRRTPYSNQLMKGAVTGLTLASDAPAVYRGLIEAAAFGARAINERFIESGVEIANTIAIGGVSKKSPLIMQICADVMNMPVFVCESDQAVALGAAIFAAVVGGVYSNVSAAQEKMAAKTEKIYHPNPDSVKIYDGLYKKYRELGCFLEDFVD